MRKQMDLNELGESRDEHSELMRMVCVEVKKNTKDPFVHQLLNTQMINNYVFMWVVKLHLKLSDIHNDLSIELKSIRVNFEV